MISNQVMNSCVLPISYSFFVGKQVFELPNPSTYYYVNDYYGAFSEKTEEYIYEHAKKLNELTSAQIIVVAVYNTVPESMSTYSSKLYDKWGISDYGVLILLHIYEYKMWMTTGMKEKGPAFIVYYENASPKNWF